MGPITGIDFERLTLRDALDLAVLIEEEARDRYWEFAEQLAAHDTPEVADFFARMARIEERHRASCSSGAGPLRERALHGGAPADSRRGGAGVRGARAFMGVRQALETVLAAEVKAHDFFRRRCHASRTPS